MEVTMGCERSKHSGHPNYVIGGYLKQRKTAF
jgi:hypothetical protein